MPCWFLDFIGYQFPARGFVIKEIAILSDDGDRCYNYFITVPKGIEPYSKSFLYQFKMHKLRWSFGDYEFNEAMMDIARKLRTDIVYIKGREKFQCMQKLFPSPKFIEMDNTPSFR